MKNIKKAAGAVVGGAIAVAALPGMQIAFAVDGNSVDCANDGRDALEASAHESAAFRAFQHILVDNVEGVFSWNQDVSADNASLSRVLYEGARYLCGEQGADAADLGEGTNRVSHIAIKGDISREFVASVESLNEKYPIAKVMGCTCKGNPADGLATANVEVSGFLLRSLVDEINPSDEVNAIVFTSADGYKVTLPFDYVMQRYSIVVSQVNGEDADSAIGCSNQLWLGNTPARAFARDVVSIEFATMEEEPEAPGASAESNQPNIGVREGAVLQ